MSLPPWYQQILRDSDRIASLGVFFIVGCQKSGTTWLQGMLDAHPQLRCDGEGHFVDRFGGAMQQVAAAYNAAANTRGNIDQTRVLAALRLWADGIFCGYLGEANDQVVAVGDKTPETALFIPPLSVVYPQSRFIHIIRDGRDGAVSGWAHLRRQGQDGQFASFADYAEYYASSHWVRYIEAARGAGAALPDRYLEVQYETLHEDPAGQLRRILEFLEVDVDDALVEQCVTHASFERLSGGRKRGEEDASSHFRKGIVGDWRNSFDDEATRRFENAAGAMMDALGYERAGVGAM